MTKICRLCLKSGNSTNSDYVSVHQSDNNGVAIATLVKTLVPELYLGLSVNPMICPPCYDALRDAYSFRLQCLRSDKLIGIFMRETHCSAVTIVLQDVVDYWLNVYKAKPCRTDVARNNLSEWFGLEEDDERPPRAVPTRTIEPENSSNKSDVITHIISNNSLLEELDERIIIDRLRKENAVTERTSPEPENSATDAQAVDGQPATGNPTECSSNFADTFQVIPKNPCDCPAGDDCPTSKDLKKGNTPFIRRTQQDIHAGCVVECEQRHEPKCKYYKFVKWLNKFPAELVQNAEGKSGAAPVPQYSPSPVPQYSPSPCPPRFKTYTNRTKTVPENPDDDRAVAFAQKVRFVPVQGSDDEVDGESLIRELQKSENLKKLGFAEDVANLEDHYVLKKFVDKTDNSLSYALLPKTVWEGAYNDTQRGKDESEDGTNCSDIVISDEQEDQSLIEKGGRQNVDLLDLETLQEAVSPQGGFENLVEVNRKVVDKLANIDCQPMSNTDSEFARPNPPEENDEESLGIIDFNEDSSSPQQPQGERMPVIRVRPVSSLQKVRTLNHELFPRPTEPNVIKPSRASMFTPPEGVPMYQIMPVQKSPPLNPPLVLNSKIIPNSNQTLLGSITLQKPSGKSSDIDASVLQISEINPGTKRSTSPTRLVPVTLEHVKKMGINPMRLKMLKLVKPVRKILPHPPAPPALIASPELNNAPPVLGPPPALIALPTLSAPPTSSALPVLTAPPALTARPGLNAPPVVTVDMRRNMELLLGEGGGPEELMEEDLMDIKEEPLDYEQNDPFGDTPQQDEEWDGETTRSASETSLMDKLLNDNISHLIGDVSDLADDEFDQPEYVHINNVSFADLTKMVKESQQGAGEDISKSNPVVDTKINLAKNVLKSPRVAITQAQPLLLDPEGDEIPDYKSYHVRSRRAPNKRGKRLRIVPVEVEQSGPVIKKRRRRAWDSITPSDSNDLNKDVCVLFTNFTNDGDYINDHDYLISPYMRNKMFFVKRKVPSCLCLLCDLVQPANVHSEHMRCHGTRCAICLVDFRNVFILNLHVRRHTSCCAECGVNVTYARYRHHAATHNMSLALSNIYLPPEYSGKPKRRGRKVKPSISVNDILESRPPVVSETSRNPVARRSRRLARSVKPVNYQDDDLDTEEASVYDKTTKSFSTPSVAKCSTPEKKETEYIEECPNRTDEGETRSDMQFVNLVSLSKDANEHSENINVTVHSPGSNSNSQSATEAASLPKRVVKIRKTRRRTLLMRRKKHIQARSKPMSPEEAPAVVINETEERTKRRKKTSSESNCLVDPTVTCDTTARGNSPNSKPGSSSNAPEPPASAVERPTKTATTINPLALKQFKIPMGEITRGRNVEKVVKRSLETRQTSSNWVGIGNKLRMPTKGVKRKGSVDTKATIKKRFRAANNDGLKMTITNVVSLAAQDSLVPELTGGRKRRRDETSVEEDEVALPLPEEKDGHASSRTGADQVSKKDDRSVEEKNGADKDEVHKPSPSGTRSSRSRGSLNLVEGLKIDAPARSRKPKKLITPVPLSTEPESFPLHSPSEQPPETTSEDNVCDNVSLNSAGSEDVTPQCD